MTLDRKPRLWSPSRVLVELPLVEPPNWDLTSVTRSSSTREFAVRCYLILSTAKIDSQELKKVAVLYPKILYLPRKLLFFRWKQLIWLNYKSNGRIFQANKIEEQSPEFTKVRDFVQFYREYLSFNWITSETIFVESIDLNIRRYQTPAFERYLNLTILNLFVESVFGKKILSTMLAKYWLKSEGHVQRTEIDKWVIRGEYVTDNSAQFDLITTQLTVHPIRFIIYPSYIV